MIKIRDLKRNFREFDFNVECRNLTVEKGNCFGIYGDAASGKSLFTMILSGVIKGYSGSIEISMTELKSTYRKKFGYLPFKNVLYNDYTVKEISRFLLEQYKLPESEYDLKSEWMSRFYNIKDISGRKIYSLSDGQLQIIKLFYSLLHSPSVLIIDEPFNGLGSGSIEFFNSVFEDLKNQEVTVLATSSNKEYLKEITSGSTLISNGTVE